MVRLKVRYLLVNILYTDVPPGHSKDGGAVSDLLFFNQPTTGNIKSPALLASIRTHVASLFGDCGSGAVERTLQGRLKLRLHFGRNARLRQA